jgi:hypothetical protein
MLAPQAPTCQAPVSPGRFVEVPQTPAPPLPYPATEIEMQRADGARLRLRSSEATLPLAAVGRAFWEVACWDSSPPKAASWWPLSPSLAAKGLMASPPCAANAWAPTLWRAPSTSSATVLVRPSSSYSRTGRGPGLC